MNAKKPILCIDFDGVIHDYKKGWQDGSIYGNATPGFFAWLEQASRLFKVVVYSSRSKTEEGRKNMAQAIGKWSIDAVVSGEISSDFDMGILGDMDFASEKPPAYLTIDDRAVTFHGSWSDGHMDPHRLRQFKPWNV